MSYPCDKWLKKETLKSDYIAIDKVAWLLLWHVTFNTITRIMTDNILSEHTDFYDKKGLWKVDPEKTVLCMVEVSLGCWSAFDNRLKFIYPLSDLFYIYLWIFSVSITLFSHSETDTCKSDLSSPLTNCNSIPHTLLKTHILLSLSNHELSFRLAFCTLVNLKYQW